MSKKNGRDPGLSYPDATRVEVPLRLKGLTRDRDTLTELVAKLSQLNRMQGVESLEESDDFDVSDEDADMDFVSQHEIADMVDEPGDRDATYRRSPVRKERERVPGARREDDRERGRRDEVRWDGRDRRASAVRSVEQDERSREEESDGGVARPFVRGAGAPAGRRGRASGGE